MNEYIMVDGDLQQCERRYVLQKTRQSWRLAQICVLSGGSFVVEDSCLGIGEIRQLFSDGQLTVSPPTCGVLDIPCFLWAKFTDAVDAADNDNFLVELEDCMRRLRGQAGVVAECRAALQAFEDEPTPRRRELLKMAYEAVPEHLRCMIGGLDVKDRRVIEALDRPV